MDRIKILFSIIVGLFCLAGLIKLGYQIYTANKVHSARAWRHKFWELTIVLIIFMKILILFGVGAILYINNNL